jgi:transcriptional regulator with XRE-family HTH domain
MGKKWKDLGSFIKGHRLKQDMTQADLAKILNKSSSEVSRWEKGERRPKEASLQVLSSIFGVRIQVLQQKAGYTPEFDWLVAFNEREQPKEDILLSASESEKEELRVYLNYLRFRSTVLKTGQPGTD